MKNTKPKVSVICMTFNHVNFIRQALDGFVMQKTNFPFEVIVHDDASTDGTSDIVREYAEKYPDIIKPIIQTENQWSRGTNISTNFIWPAVHGEYVAECDGDDYWTDPNKLQKQVDFLDANPDYSVCFHPVRCFYEDNTPERTWPTARELRDVSLNKLMEQNFIPNCSVMYRWCDPTHQWPTYIYPGDWFLHLWHARRGLVKCLPDIMARYRRHRGGVSYVSEYGADALHIQWGILEMNFFNAVEKLIAPDPAQYHGHVIRRAREIIAAYVAHQDFDKAHQILTACPDARTQSPIGDASDVKKWRKRFNRLLLVDICMVAVLICLVILLLIK